MREGVLLLREARRRPLRLGAGAVRDVVARHRPAWLVGAGGAVLLGGVGAFDTGEAAPWTLYSYWLILMLAGVAAVLLCREWLERKRVLVQRPSSRAAAVTAMASVAMVPLVWLMAGLAMGGSWRVWRMVELMPQVLLVMGLLTGLLSMIARREPLPEPAAAPADGPASGAASLLRRLPDRLAEAELLAVEAEDHYLRFHTDRGSALLLMRLGDALADLQPAEGARTHRSWWVARGAVIAASRGRGRATLTLRNGLVVPVSRTYSPELRRNGWY